LLFKSQNAPKQGGIHRQQVKKAVLDNVAKVKAVTGYKEEAAPTRARSE
jgi:hypothetical protein